MGLLENDENLTSKQDLICKINSMFFILSDLRDEVIEDWDILKISKFSDFMDVFVEIILDYAVVLEEKKDS